MNKSPLTSLPPKQKPLSFRLSVLFRPISISAEWCTCECIHTPLQTHTAFMAPARPCWWWRVWSCILMDDYVLCFLSNDPQWQTNIVPLPSHPSAHIDMHYHLYGHPHPSLMSLHHMPLTPDTHRSSIHLPSPAPSCPAPCWGDFRCSLASLGHEERDLTSSLYSQRHPPLYYLLMERSSHMNSKVGAADSVKACASPTSFFSSSSPLCPVSTLTSLPPLNLDARKEEKKGMTEKGTDSALSKSHRRRKRYRFSISAEWQSRTKKKLFEILGRISMTIDALKSQRGEWKGGAFV